MRIKREKKVDKMVIKRRYGKKNYIIEYLYIYKERIISYNPTIPKTHTAPI